MPSTPSANIASSTAPKGLEPQDYDQLDAWLDGLRERGIDAPQWEFCDGFMAALACARSQIPRADGWQVLFDTEASLEALFPDAEARLGFEALWERRWQETLAALDAEVESLDDERAYCPQALDVRSAIGLMDAPAQAQALGLQAQDEAAIAEAMAQLPSFAQLWALGFMLAVEAWPDEWQAPSREKDIAGAIEESLGMVAALCEDDTGPAEVSAYVTDDDGEGPPSMSTARLEEFGQAVWAVYDLREAARTLGPRVAQVRRDAPAPGRNDLCHCGSGKKYKKCHGAG